MNLGNDTESDDPPSPDPSVQRLRTWVVDALVNQAGFTKRDAESAFDRCIAYCAEYKRFLEHLRSQSVDAVTAARATALCPDGVTWWREAGAVARKFILEGRFVEGYVRQAEQLAGPSDVDVDFNWPDEKLFRVVDVPVGCSLGDEVIAGDGEGNRARLVVAERDGVLGLVADLSTFRNPTDDLWRGAWDEAEALLSAESP